MRESERTWIVLARDVSRSVRLADASTVVLCLVLDAATGFALATTVGPSRRKACRDAFATALAEPVPPLDAAPPARVITDVEHRGDVQAELERQLPDRRLPDVDGVTPQPEAEDVFDSLVGHMCGRRQPEQFPTPDDWRMLMGLANSFRDAEPWTAWSDTVHHQLTIRVDGTEARFVAVVLGHEGIQRGLAMYPGERFPNELQYAEPGQTVMPPDGTLLFYLDPSAEVPAEYVGKARRYGWSDDVDDIPITLIMGPDGAADLGALECRHLTVGMAAILNRVPGTEPGVPTGGVLPLAHGAQGEYTALQG
ncbi:hypothetical protein [Phytoactinopolyspora halotolerans]|uniref:Uncharacterized protein n=1 Tax=Phytoactinopolyspora halotolerans TaxID=1981512 RepID=A0A6L9SEU7_9ACTN|nr:hypothetical protein [Phytoactinopolyspora halotolerans]NEE03766.1 hypothetical protein [Phytoactinopolyspora halotolerans]